MAQREFAMRWTPPYMLQMLLHLAISKPSTVAFKCASNCKHSSLESKCIDCIIVEVLGHKKISFVNICDETPNLVQYLKFRRSHQELQLRCLNRVLLVLALLSI